MTEPAVFDAPAILTALDHHHVKYVIIGGYAAQLHGATKPTTDIHVTPATTTENLDRLATALRTLRAGVRVDDLPDGLPFDTSAEALRGIEMLRRAAGAPPPRPAGGSSAGLIRTSCTAPRPPVPETSWRGCPEVSERDGATP